MLTDRLYRLQSALTAAGLDGVAAIAGPNLVYLTGLGFHLSERPSVGFFPAQGDPVFVVGQLEASKFQGLPYPARVFTYTDTAGPAGAFAQAAQALPRTLRRLAVEARRMRVMELGVLARSSGASPTGMRPALAGAGPVSVEPKVLRNGAWKSCVSSAIWWRGTRSAMQPTVSTGFGWMPRDLSS